MAKTARALAACLVFCAAAASAQPSGRLDALDTRAEFQALFGGVLPSPVAPLPIPGGVPVPPRYAPGDKIKGKVVKVLDADSLIVAAKDGEVNIRLDAVDAPETAHPEHGKKGQPYGEEAAAFVRGLAEGKTVTVHIKELDKYGRFIGSVTLPGGRSLQEEILRNGWAWWNFFFNKDEALNKLENEAIAAGRGLWAGKKIGGEHWPEAPWVFRRRESAGIRRILPGEVITFKVKHLPDADTVALGTRQPVYDYIRLAGIDAPEVSRTRTKPGQPYAVEAGARASELVEAEGMKIDVEIEDVDPYGRLVGWIRLRGRGGESLNELLVEEGLAWWYERYYPNHAELARKQARARAARLGLWADPNPVPPWDYRRSQRPN